MPRVRWILHISLTVIFVPEDEPSILALGFFIHLFWDLMSLLLQKILVTQKNSVEVASLQFRRAPVSVVVQLGRFRSRPTRRWAMAAMTLCGVVPRYNRKPSRPQQWCWIEEILQLLEFFRRIVDAFWVMQDLLQQKYCDWRNLPKVAYGFKKIRRIQTMCFRPVGWDFVHKFRSGAKVNRSWIFTG